MGEMSYSRVGKRTRSHVSSFRGGFRINSKRFSVHRLRSRFIFFLRIFHRLRSSYGHALQSIKKGLALKRNSRDKHINVKNYDFGHVRDCDRLGSFGRSNSFYAEAIADCLEFIKRSSVSVDQ